MTVATWKLPFALDPLIAEAKRRARQRRVLLALGLVLLVGLGAGLTLALQSPGGPSGGPLSGPLVTANYPEGFSLRYPSVWSRVPWCYAPPSIPTPIGLLTNAEPAPKCSLTHSRGWPPAEQLGPNVVSVALAHGTGFGGVPTRWNTHIAGRPAYAYSAHDSTVDASLNITCPAGVRRADRHLMIRGSTPAGLLSVYATICGPDLDVGNAAVNRILASLRFTR